MTSFLLVLSFFFKILINLSNLFILYISNILFIFLKNNILILYNKYMDSTKVEKSIKKNIKKKEIIEEPKSTLDATPMENDDLVQEYINNLNSKEYIDYLQGYKKIIEEKNKCVRNKSCSSNISFEKKKIIFTKKMEKKELLLPKYILIDERLDEIKKEKDKCDNEIRLVQNKINVDSEEKDIEKYQKNRDLYMELEKEESNLLKYLKSVNKTIEIDEKKTQIKSSITLIKKGKILLYAELQNLHQQKNSKNFNNEVYNEKLKKY